MDRRATWLWVEDSVYRDGQLVAADRPSAEGGRRHFHSDHLGTPRLITNDLGLRYAAHDYFPFGTETTDFRQEMTEHQFDRAETRQFTGHERDFISSTELSTANYIDYMHARYYSASMGRFLSVDPVLGTPRRSQSWNRYSYADNSPINLIDPTGAKETGYTCDQNGDNCVYETTQKAEDYTALDTASDTIDGSFETLFEMSGVGDWFAGAVNDNPRQMAKGVVKEMAFGVGVPEARSSQRNRRSMVVHLQLPRASSQELSFRNRSNS